VIEPDKIYIGQFIVLGEQDGPFEQVLKEELISLFRRDTSVVRAYLAKADSDCDEGVDVILAVRTHFGPDLRLVEQVDEIFASIFSDTEHLDIIFLNEDQEVRVAAACRPFFAQ
jgi:hypothetical protein